MNSKFDHELIMSQREYERTGRQVRVPEDELVSIVLDRIDHYLTLHPRERRNYPDPRTEPVITRIASGKTIEIPQQLVDKALEVHSACGTVGTVERMGNVSNNVSGAHTRLAKRERYANSDPYVMDKDLQGENLLGYDGQVAGNAVFNDYPQRYNDFNKRMNGQISKSRNASDLNDRADPLNSYSHERLDRCEAKKKAAGVLPPAAIYFFTEPRRYLVGNACGLGCSRALVYHNISFSFREDWVPVLWMRQRDVAFCHKRWADQSVWNIKLEIA